MNGLRITDSCIHEHTPHIIFTQMCLHHSQQLSAFFFFFFEWVGWEIGVGIFLSSKCKNINEKSSRISETATFLMGH